VEEGKMNLSLRRGSSVVTERGSHPFTYTVDGLPEGQEARVINQGTEKTPDWHFSRRLKPDEQIIVNRISYLSAEEAFAALTKEVTPGVKV
jgi:hypothetical protein